ncbi:uncharacterized protein LOC135085977 [Ostrinia nubilalis]|uniref:uncharacterized protein LOC135085977 n=1 Tax=Ostrinia nubilalis TaxID=29057 RepID=UPI0030825529
MATSGDVTIAQDGGQGNVKAHPYLVALVRWCVSCLWSTATLLIHRLLAGHALRPSIAASKPVKQRVAGTEHLHPIPKVECQVLHAPTHHSIDVIFVHGLCGSLGNTWRQGDWREKYELEPSRVPLLRPSPCQCIDKRTQKSFENDFKNIDDLYKFKKLISNDEAFTTEKFFNETLDQVEILDNFETQAQFVRDLFENENREEKCEEVKPEEVDCVCKVTEGRQCEVGCGCVCDECYSTCWPRDWIKEDYPEARVISINYTSDPYLWRPLWIKQCKRLRLHERAEQMTKQLLELGVGERPIIWVGHSKGGLFIKQIYCEAYEAYLQSQKDNISNTLTKTNEEKNQFRDENETTNANDIENNNDNVINERNEKAMNELNCNINEVNNIGYENDNVLIEDSEKEIVTEDENKEQCNESNADCKIVKLEREISEEDSSSNSQEDSRSQQASLWLNSAGFMFYSVPHRGSPLADIKTPITARSIEILEISKDCSLVLSLQDRWLKATDPSRPPVRSLVETCKTLMSVLWLRIVSVPSADAGIGSLYGVPVDHREICKPTSRHCMLYKELMTLMHAALKKCRCESETEDSLSSSDQP